MTKEQKQTFTVRVTQANKTEMVVILYDMTLTYLSDAKKRLTDGNKAGFRMELTKARSCVKELIASLNTRYELAGNLLNLYLFCNKQMNRSFIDFDATPLEAVENTMTQLRDAYNRVSREDTSGPVMQNTETVYSGYTYNRSSLAENLTEPDRTRGYLA